MKFIGHTDIGQVRQGNEDAFAGDMARQVVVLADGMGGLNAGEVASRQAVDAFLRALPSADSDSTQRWCDALVMENAIDAANEQVYQLSHSNPAWRHMGTTLVACALDGRGQWVVGHVGDSRAYLLRAQRLLPLTKDHSVVQEMLDQGLMSALEAQTAPNRHIITRAVGLEAQVQPTVTALQRLPGDLLLLCSDGLSDMIDDDSILQLLTQRESLAGATAQLVAAANRAGGRDNVTVVLIES